MTAPMQTAAPVEGGGPSPVVRRVWMTVGSIALVAAVGFGTIQLVSVVAHGHRVVRTNVDPSGVATMEITTESGSVTVVGDSEAAIRVIARISDGLRASSSSVTRSGDRLVVRGSCPVFAAEHCSVDYEVHAPAGIDVVVRTDDGAIGATDLTQRVDLASDNGDIEASALSGAVKLASDNGDIDGLRLRSAGVGASTDNGNVSLSFERAPSDVSLVTDNGDLMLLLPTGDETYAVDATTDNGAVDTPIRTDPLSDRRIRLVSDNGDIAARYSTSR